METARWSSKPLKQNLRNKKQPFRLRKEFQRTKKETANKVLLINERIFWEKKKGVDITKDKFISFLETGNDYLKKLCGKKSRKQIRR